MSITTETSGSTGTGVVEPRGDGKDQIIKGHRYDGIHEYDNPMPGWWLWIFWGSIVFAIIYVLGLHLFNFIPSYTDDLSSDMRQIQDDKAAYEQAHPTFQADEASLAKIVADPVQTAEGGKTFATYCAACHGDKGQGLIGPNLTDNYWIHGGQLTDLFKIVSEGVAAKGMPAWQTALTPDKRAQVIAFIESLHGTNPPGGKAPEGEKFEKPEKSI